MNPSTRALKIEEQFFKTPVLIQLPSTQAIAHNKIAGSPIHVADNLLLQTTPKADLTAEMIHQSSSWSKTGRYLKKNWPILVLGAVSITLLYFAVKNQANTTSTLIKPNRNGGSDPNDNPNKKQIK